jgi:hypothetical protein
MTVPAHGFDCHLDKYMQQLCKLSSNKIVLNKLHVLTNLLTHARIEDKPAGEGRKPSSDSGGMHTMKDDHAFPAYVFTYLVLVERFDPTAD